MSSHDNTEIFEDTEDAENPQLTELVAYLDGELGEPESQRIERQLASDPPLRCYAESLDKTWQLLDSLEEAAASGEFTRKTLASLETLAHEDHETPVPNSLPQRIRSLGKLPLLRIGLWTAAGFLGCSMGLLFARQQRPQQKESADSQILRQLDLLQQYQKIRPVPSADFLDQLTTLEQQSARKDEAP